MTAVEARELIGRVKKLAPLKSHDIYFKVKICDVKRQFGFWLAKIVPDESDDVNNSAWVRVSALS